MKITETQLKKLIKDTIIDLTINEGFKEKGAQFVNQGADPEDVKKTFTTFKMLKDKWIVFKNSSLLSKQLTDDILTIAHHSIKLNGSFKIVLTGGRSLIKTYDILRRSDSDWSKWHVYISDERLLPAMHKDRNDQLINKIWLNNNSIPRENIHFIRSELSPI